MIQLVTFHSGGLVHIFRRWRDGRAETWCGYYGKPTSMKKATSAVPVSEATCSACRTQISQVKVSSTRTRKEES